jgi:hypothetical protein
LQTKTGSCLGQRDGEKRSISHIPYEGDALRPFTEYRWTVWIEDDSGDFAEASSMFERAA